MAFKFENHCATGYKNLRASNHYNPEALPKAKPSLGTTLLDWLFKGQLGDHRIEAGELQVKITMSRSKHLT